jgi:hypothetical protein
MKRRRFLAGAAATLGAATAGCGSLQTQSTRSPPMVEDRPDAVYVPSHIEGMAMAGTARQGRYRFALTYSFPHRFWRVTAGRTTKVEIREEDSVHLMLTAWDGETGTVIPTSSAQVTATSGGETVVPGKKLWSMLSQNMGVHFGDNLALDGEGTYDVTVDFGPVETRLAGGLAGALPDRASPSFTLDFDQGDLDSVSYERLADRQGERDAVDPMGMEMVPSGQVPSAGDLPGETLGTAESGDARLAVTTLPVPAGVDGEGTYLAVSARTPYNRYPLPFMSLSAILSRGGEAVFDGELTATLHPDLGYHYGAVVDGVESGDGIDFSVAAPPQISRHEGYETAFLSLPDASLSV